MKEIFTERVVIDTTYEAVDGKIFTSEYECKYYEEDLDFNNFKPDKKKMKEGFNENNSKDFLHDFLHTFYEYPLTYKRNFFSEKAVELSFFIDILYIFNTNREYKEYEYDSVERFQRRFNLVHNNLKIESDLVRKYKKGITIEKVFKYFFDKLKIKLDDFVKLDLFLISYQNDNLKGFDILLKNGFDIEKYINKMSESANKNWWGSEYKRDFISYLALNKIKKYFDKDTDTIDKRSRWLKAILDLDPKIKLFKYKSSKTIYENINECYTTDNKDKGYIPVNLDELIHKLKYTFNIDKKVYEENIGVEPIVEVLLNAKENFKKINSVSQKSDELLLAEETVKKTIEIFHEFPEIKSFVDIEDLEIGVICRETIPKFAKDTHHRMYLENRVEFLIEDTHNMFKGKKTNQVFIYSLECYNGGNVYEYRREVIKFLNLNDYKNNPKKLAEDIVLYLNDNIPIAFEKIEDIKNMNAKILETERYLKRLKDQRKIV